MTENTPIVRMIQELVHTWGPVGRDRDGHYMVPIYFECQEDAELFTVEMMMVASGQTDYEKPGTDGQSEISK